MMTSGASRTFTRLGRFAIGAAMAILALPIVATAQDRNSSNGTAGQDRGSPTIAKSEIRALGRVLPESGLVTVGARPGIRIVEIKAKAGRTVKKGDPLAVLEGNATAVAQLAVAEQQKTKADFDRDLKKEMLDVQRSASDALNKSRLDKLDALIQEHHETLKLLVDRNKPAPANTPKSPGPDPDLVISQYKAEIFKLETERDALANQREAEKKLRPKEDKELGAGTPGLTLLDKQIDLARAQLEQTLVRSPSNGVVLDVLAHEGEVSSGPLLYLGDLTKMVVRAEVYQDDVENINKDAAVTVYLPSKPTTYKGKVVEVGKLVQPNSLTSLDPRERVDRRIIHVTILLDNPEYFANYVNMQVQVKINPKSSLPK